MLKKLPIILALIVVVLVLVLIFWNNPSSEAPTIETPVSGGDAAEENTVVFTDTGFSPSELTVRTGDTVAFVNESSADFWPASAIHPTHEVYAGTSLGEHCPDETGEAFDACGGILAGESWSFTFLKPGTWKYHDHLNASRTGTIVVE